MTSPEPIVRNDFVEEAEAFIHSVGGYVLVQHLVVSGDNDNDDDEDMDVNDDDGNGKKIRIMMVIVIYCLRNM